MGTWALALSLSCSSSNSPVLWVEGGMVMGHRALAEGFGGFGVVPPQTQHETTVPWHTRNLQNGWNWIQSVSPQLCHHPTTVTVQLSSCRMSEGGSCTHRQPQNSFWVKILLLCYYLHFYSIRRCPLGAGLPCQPLHKHQRRWSLSQRDSSLSSKWRRKEDNCFRNLLYLVKCKVADFCQVFQLSG